MLILTRAVDQETYIKLEDGRVITIMVTEVWDKHAKIGITAPRSIQVVRAEAHNQDPKLFSKTP